MAGFMDATAAQPLVMSVQQSPKGYAFRANGVIIPKHWFEICAEGGGNTFSLDIDSKGRVFTGTNGATAKMVLYQ